MYMLAILLMLVRTSLIVEVKMKAFMVNVYIFYIILLQKSSHNVTKKHTHTVKYKINKFNNTQTCDMKY